MRYLALAGLFALGCGSSSKPATTPPTGGSTTTAATGTTTTTPASTSPAAPAPSNKTLFERLGGLPAIKAVVEEFVGRTTTDPRVKQRFFNTDPTSLKQLLVEFVCMASGGGCKYTGRDMPTSHGGMELVDEEFNAVVEDLVGALDKFNVPAKEKGELLGAIGPLKPQIVAPPGTLKPIDEAKLAPVTALAGKQKDKNAQELLTMAVTAGKRGQRSYAEQLFSRAELIVGAKELASVAGVFREGAPPRVTTALKKADPKAAPQPEAVGSSEQDAPDKKPEKGSLTGTLQLDGKPLKGLAVVMLTPKKGGFKKRVAKTRTIEQRDKSFLPKIMAVPVGSTITFPNFDTIYHNVFSLSKPKAFDLGLYKSGEYREVKFDKPGVIRIGCNIHANMAAHVIVVDAPHYVVVDGEGKFKFNSLKPGTYKVESWSDQSAAPSVSEVEIKAGANETKLDLTGGAAAGPGPDKFGVTRDMPTK